jgi:hypothetical protein
MLLALAVPVAAMVAASARHLRECIELGWDNVALLTAVAEVYTVPWFGAYLLLRHLGRHGTTVRCAGPKWPLGAVVGAAMGLFAGWVFAFTVVMGSHESAILLVMPSVVAFVVYLPGIGGTVLGALFAHLLARLVRFPGRDPRVGTAGTKTPR